MRSVSAAVLIFSCVASIASAAPTGAFTFDNDPLHNGFPNPSPDQIIKIEQAAHGSLPIAAAAAKNATSKAPSADTLTSLRFIAFNELFEVAFFTSLINNITAGVDGFKINNGTAQKYLLDDLTAIQAQEELHALNANNGLKANKQNPIQPCQYVFPTTNLKDAIALASKFTDIVLATLPDIQTGFATNGDNGLIRGVGAVIGQEGEQNGFYRQFDKKNKKIPSALPFLTAGTRNFAFSALNQNFVVPGSCPNIQDITNDKNIAIFDALAVETDGGNLKPQTQNVKFSFVASEIKPEWKGTNSDWTGLSLVYINQQNAPISEKLLNVQATVGSNGITISFEASFPFDGVAFGNGLTLAAVVPSNSDVSSVTTVSAATLAGPGLIEVN
ncbi:hypothetical protein LHYA1_G006933 [Lachnellula hyalina]|uniref:Sexual development protein n=1 Tax=Lachnellula hyalina TaxID=1316788 RepID=A0A8H8QYC4_9HELO|nr:uncharacterized protein LHYA1_G006933 [Lachnellula hyalina]TVY24000.1 hypothetical protein LHYA1_G006933 [Lachnellula hyalina]